MDLHVNSTCARRIEQDLYEKELSDTFQGLAQTFQRISDDQKQNESDIGEGKDEKAILNGRNRGRR